MFYIPIINIPLVKSHSKASDEYNPDDIIGLAMFDSLLTGIVSFPLYIINLSYLCETVNSYDQISIYNIIQLIISILNFIKTPPLFLLAHLKWQEDADLSNKIKVVLSATLGFILCQLYW